MAQVEMLELTVEGNAIHCSGCESRIQGTLGKLPGVQKVKASHKSQKIILALDQEKTPLWDVLAKLEFLGYTVAQKSGPRAKTPVGATVLLPKKGEKMRRLDAVCSFCTGGVSVICMSSMGAALAAAGTVGGAGAVGMAGMGSMGVSSTGASAFFIIPRFFDRVGLDFLNQVPNAVAQPLLVALLTISLVASYLAYRGHRRLYAPALTLASSAAMYVSIYVWMSEPLYFVSLGGLLAVGVWGIFLARRPRLVH